MVWPVESSWRTARVGSSITRRCSVVASRSSSDCFAAAIATPYTGRGSVGSIAVTGVPSGASVSPVRVSASLVTATMSPAPTESTCVCEFPVSEIRLWSRSLAPERELTRTSSARSVPESTLSSEIWPRNSSTVVLNTSTSGAAPGSGTTSTMSPAASTVAGPASPGAGPTRQMKSASWSAPIGVVADPHRTGNASARSTASCRRRSS